MARKGRIGAYRKEDRVELPPELQRRLVDSAAARYGDCQKLAKALGVPKSSVHYYRAARLTMPTSLLERMLEAAGDAELEERVREQGRTKDRTWANAYACSIFREQCRQRVNLPTLEELRRDGELRRKAASIISYVMAEGSIWIRDDKWGEGIVNITFADHEHDLYNHFRTLCLDVFRYDIGAPQKPGNDARAIRGFIYSRFVAEWLMVNGVPSGDKSSQEVRLPSWVTGSDDSQTWISSLQPWCDGEGSVSKWPGSRNPSFSLSQARHTDIDFHVMTCDHGCTIPSRSLRGVRLRRGIVYEMPLLCYCSAFSRSEILEDIRTLFLRLGLRHRLSLDCLYLKDDGYCSCVWRLYFASPYAKEMTGLGLVTQRRKVRALVGF
jgi:hypothetical protein